MSNAYVTEIISVGTEILLGHIINTDARDISEELSNIGINVKYHTVVGDNPERLAQCVENAKKRANIIITTGGLGPTCDDLTKTILTSSFGLKLYQDENEVRFLQEYYKGRNVTPNNWSQTMLPEGCTVFHNTCGTAPGCGFEKDGIVVIMLPGPPRECRAMLKVSVLPYLKQLNDEKIVSHSIRIFGIGESAVDYMFRDEMNAMTNPTMAPYAKEADCLLQITAKGATEEEAEAMVRPVIEQTMEKLGEFAVALDVDSMEEAVFALLKQKGLTFAAAESCTGGYVAKRMTDMPGTSEVFAGGVVTYTNEAKTALLGIDSELIRTKSAVSREVAQLMAENVRRILGADIGVSVTGIAGPGTDGIHQVGDVFVAMAAEEQTWVRELHLGTKRSRNFIRQMSGNHVYDMMRRYLNGIQMEQTKV